MLNGLMLIGNNWFTNALRYVTYFIDKGIYALAEGAYTVFRYLANASILDETIARNFTMRMYAVLGVIMVFVIAFNLLTYIVNPDKITDKKVGASAFIKDVVIALVIIAMTPLLFTKLYSLQNAILSTGVIENLILGGNSGNETAVCEGFEDGDYKSITECSIENGANTMIASVYVAFLYPEDGSNFTALDCGNPDSDHEEYCNAYQETKRTGSITSFFDFITREDYNYTPFLTTVAGIVLLFFMLSFCINLAKRIGKLAIIQLMAPVPVTLELLPNKKGLRKVWIDNLIKTYLEVFFYLAVMYLIILLISFIPNTVAKIAFGTGGNLGIVKLLTIVMLIFGLLKFGKEAPQLIFDLIGIKSTGIIKEAALRGVKMAGSVTSGVGAGITSSVRNGYDAFDSFKNGNIKGGLSHTAGVLTSGVTGVARGMYANRSGGFKGIKGRTASAINTNLAHQGQVFRTAASYGKSIEEAAKRDGIRAGIKAAARPATEPFVNWATGSGSYSKLNTQISAMDKAKSYFKNVTKDFKPYEDASRVLNEAKAKTDYATVYNSWKASNPTLKEKDFITSIAGDPRYAEVVNAYNQQENVKAERIEKQKENIINNALDMLSYIDVNPQIGLTPEATVFKDKLSTMVDKEGNIAAGSTIKDIYSTLDDLSTQLGKDITTASRTISRQKIVEEAKKNGNTGSGTSGK